jgi:Domain of unknown function (DUF4142)
MRAVNVSAVEETFADLGVVRPASETALRATGRSRGLQWRSQPAMRVPRLSAMLVVLLIVAGVLVTWQTWRTTPTSGAPGQEGWVSTAWGPLGPADRDLIVRVRLAGLWEHPSGQEMDERGVQPRVREIGSLIHQEHLQLDALTVDTAKKLGVLLPNQPTAEQQAWMRQISASTGSAYDYTAVNLLRAAHGAVLPTIINVRVGTRNALVREFADQATGFVERHISYLESTGLVDFDRLDEPPSPPRAVVTRAGQYENVPVALVALAALVVIAAIVALVIKVVNDRRRVRTTVLPDRRRAGPDQDRGST